MLFDKRALYAQPAGALPRLGLLWIKSKANSQNFDLMVEALRVRGYVAGKNIEFDDRFLADRYNDLPAMAEKLARERYTVILCFGATATLAMGKATSMTPIVTVSGLDPVKAGFAESLARPRKNMTGYVTEGEPMGLKRLELIKEALPGLRKLGVLYAPQSPYQSTELQMIRSKAGKLKLQVEALEIRSPEEISSIATRVRSAGVGGLHVGSSTLFRAHLRELMREIEATRLPAIFPGSEYVVAGGLLSYGPNMAMRFQKGAVFVERVLKGAKPGDIAIEQETKYDLAINLKTAKSLGLTIPPSVMVRADKVIE